MVKHIKDTCGHNSKDFKPEMLTGRYAIEGNY